MKRYFVPGIAKKMLIVTTIAVSAAWSGLSEAQDKNQALVGAAARMDLNEAQTLLCEGADVNAKDRNDRSALMVEEPT